MFSKYTDSESYLDFLISIGRRTGYLSETENNGEKLTISEHFYLLSLIINDSKDTFFDEIHSILKGPELDSTVSTVSNFYIDYLRTQDEKKFLDDIKNTILGSSNESISTLLADHFNYKN